MLYQRWIIYYTADYITWDPTHDEMMTSQIDTFFLVVDFKVYNGGMMVERTRITLAQGVM